MTLKIVAALAALVVGSAALAAAGGPRTLQIETFGDGPLVVFVPGLASDGDVWDGTVARLDGIEADVVTLAGFGDAPAVERQTGVVRDAVDDLVAHLESRAPDGAALVGHSMGGLIAQIVAAERPDLVTKLVIVDAAPFFAALQNPAATEDSAAPVAAAFRDQIKAAPRATFLAQQRATAAGMTIGDADVERVAAWSETADQATIADALYEVMTTDRRGALGAIKADTLVIAAWAEGGPFTKAQSEAFWSAQYQGLDDVRVEVVEGVRHFVMLDAPDRFAELLGEFLAPAL